MKRIAINALLSTSLMSAFATQAGAETKFDGSGEFGYTNNNGTTESSNLYSALNFSLSRDKDELATKIEANQQSENNITTQERYLLDLQYNRYYSDDKDFYSFVAGNFVKSVFESIELDSIYSLGLGRTLYKTDDMALKGEAGLGYQVTNYTAAANQPDDKQSVATLKLDFSYTINESVDFEQDLEVNHGSELTKTETNTAVKVKLGEQLRLKAGFKYRHNTKPADDAKKTDTQTLLTLVYDF